MHLAGICSYTVMLSAKVFCILVPYHFANLAATSTYCVPAKIVTVESLTTNNTSI